MDNKSNLEKTVEFALRGAPEIKADEKRKWLGEFRERVVFGLTVEAALQMESIAYVEKAMEDPEAKMLIVNNRLPSEIINKYMQLAKRVDREYKSVETEFREAMGVVIASRYAINRETVESNIKILPQRFRNLRSKKLCNACYAQIENDYAEYQQFYEKITFGDKMIGIKCGACDRDKTDAIMM